MRLAQEQYRFQPGDPVEHGFKWVLLLGRIIGVSPISVSLKPVSGTLHFELRSFSVIHSASLITVLSAALAAEIWVCVNNIGTYPNILDELGGVEDPIYLISLLSVYIYWLRNAPTLIRTFRLWSATNKQLELAGSDRKFPRFCLKTTIAILGTSAFEVILYNMYLMRKDVTTLSGRSLTENIYKINVGPLSNYVPHWSSITSAFIIYSISASYFAGNFADIFLITFCRAISFKFAQIGEEMESIVDSELGRGFGHVKMPSVSDRDQPMQIYVVPHGFDKGGHKKESIWKDIHEKVLLLCGLAEEVTNFVAPLVLACYIHNIFFVILQVLRLIYEPETGHSAYVYVSTIQFALRVVLVTYFAAEVYHSTECLLKSLERYPDSIFSPSAYRLERMLQRHPASVTLLGTVQITRYIFVSLLTFLFTAEIVLLQAMSAGKGKFGARSDCNCSVLVQELLMQLK